MIKDLADLEIVLGEDDLGLGVGEDEADVLMLCGRVDRRGGGSGTHDRKVGKDPLHPRTGCDRHAVLGLNPEGKQAGC
jgi:hypothetical protein